MKYLKKMMVERNEKPFTRNWASAVKEGEAVSTQAVINEAWAICGSRGYVLRIFFFLFFLFLFLFFIL